MISEGPRTCFSTLHFLLILVKSLSVLEMDVNLNKSRKLLDSIYIFFNSIGIC